MEFRSEFMRADGTVVTAVLEASDEQELHENLHLEGCTLLRLLETSEGLKSSVAKKLPAGKLLVFIQSLESSLDAGVPILAALEAIEAQEEDFGHRELFAAIRRGVAAGEPMSKSMARHPRCFPPVMTALIQAGEESGGLTEVLQALCDYMEWKADINATMRQAMIYPLVVFGAGYCLFLFMLSWVLPSIGGLLGKLGPDALPAAGQYLMALSDVVAANILWVIAGTIAAVVGFVMLLRSDTGRDAIVSSLSRIPIARRVIFTLNLTSLFRNMSVLLDAGLSLPHCLELVADSMTLPSLRDSVIRTMDSVLGGERLHASFGKEDILPPVALGMLQVGETSGRISVCMKRLARTYDREAKAAVARALAMLEPIVTAGLGLMVGGVAVLIISTLYSAMGSIGK